MTTGHCESSLGSSDECRTAHKRPSTLRPSHLTWAVSPPVGSYRLQPPSPFIIITQPEKLILIGDGFTELGNTAIMRNVLWILLWVQGDSSLVWRVICQKGHLSETYRVRGLELGLGSNLGSAQLYFGQVTCNRGCSTCPHDDLITFQ